MNINPKTNPLKAAVLAALLSSTAGTHADGSGAEGLEPLDCVINPSVVADLGSGVPGILSVVKVDRSDLVNQGDVVAELESSVEALALDLARARAQMDAEVNLRRVNAAFGQRQQQRTEDLYQRKAISTNDMDERNTEARLAGLQLRQALENKQLAQLEEQRAEKMLERRTIQSPITGVVMDRFKTIGEYVEDQPVLRVAQLDPLHVEVFVPVEHLGQVHQGMRAQVWSESVPDSSWQAKVSRVDRVADVASGTYGVRLELPNPDYRVPAGLRCRVQFVAEPDGPVVTDAEPEPSAIAAVQEPVPTDGQPMPVATETADEPAAETAQIDEASQPSRAEAILAGLARAKENEADAPAAEAAPDPAPVDTAVVEAIGDVSPAGDEVADAAAHAERPEPVEPLPIASSPAAPVASVDEPAQDEVALAPLATPAELPLCQWAGPFADAASANRKALALRRSGLEVKVEERSGLVQSGLRVLTPKMPSRGAAKALFERLQAAGFSDLYIVTRGKYTDHVALGLYKNQAPAHARAERVQASGFEAEVQPWLQQKTEYFLNVRGMPNAEGAKLLGALPVPATDDGVETGPCEQLASR